MVAGWAQRHGRLWRHATRALECGRSWHHILRNAISIFIWINAVFILSNTIMSGIQTQTGTLISTRNHTLLQKDLMKCSVSRRSCHNFYTFMTATKPSGASWKLRAHQTAFSTIMSKLLIKHILQMHHDQQRTAWACVGVSQVRVWLSDWGRLRIMQWSVQWRQESNGFHLYVIGGWSLLSPSYV